MATYIVLYKFTADGAKTIRESVKRTGRIRQDNARRGFKVMDVFWTQGPYDMVAIVDAPTEEAMMGAMMNVVSAGNVSSTTMRAFDAPAMSRILATVPSLEDERAPAKKSAAKGARAPKKASGR
ncbi:MAG: GYD domain-containing protein [Dehalococcoidia bacterium]